MASESKYCYDNGVLINKFGLTDGDKLGEKERATTTFKITNLVLAMKQYYGIDNDATLDSEYGYDVELIRDYIDYNNINVTKLVKEYLVEEDFKKFEYDVNNDNPYEEVSKSKLDYYDLKKYLRDNHVNKLELKMLVYFLSLRLFSVDGYLCIHKYIFRDIYPVIAGRVRDEAINKSNDPYYTGKTSFCYPSFISENLEDFLRKISFFRVNDNSDFRNDLLNCIAKYYGEINVVHPFREGNGRTLRTFMVLFVDYLSAKRNIGYNVKLSYSLWNDEDREKLLRGSIINAVSADCEDIKECFDKVLVSEMIKKKSR